MTGLLSAALLIVWFGDAPVAAAAVPYAVGRPPLLRSPLLSIGVAAASAAQAGVAAAAPATGTSTPPSTPAATPSAAPGRGAPATAGAGAVPAGSSSAASAAALRGSPAAAVPTASAPSALVSAAPAAASPVPTSPSALFRIFLTDGTALASYGEFARVGERVVFTLPIGDERRMASVGAAEVDWAKTDSYTNAVRAAHYGATRGDADYAVLSQRVARMLTEISRLSSADDQLRLAEAARLVLADWPKSHYGYKAAEVHETLGVLDEIIGGLRARAGRSNFDLNLVSGAAVPPPAPLLIAPSLQDSIAQVLRLSPLAASPAERLDLLRGALTVLDGARGTLPRDWVGRTRGRLRDAIDLEEQTDRAYATLVSSALGSSAAQASKADVRGLARLRDRVLQRDQRLGRRRPEQVQSLIATLDQRLDAARRLRLARDQWQVRARGYREYTETIAPSVTLLERSAALLGDIKALAGPTSQELARLDQRLAGLAPALRRVKPPEELRPAHMSLLSAWQMAEAAVRQRARAVAGNDMQTAWDASAAAAGALMLFERARADLAQATRAPELP